MHHTCSNRCVCVCLCVHVCFLLLSLSSDNFAGTKMSWSCDCHVTVCQCHMMFVHLSFFLSCSATDHLLCWNGSSSSLCHHLLHTCCPSPTPDGSGPTPHSDTDSRWNVPPPSSFWCRQRSTHPPHCTGTKTNAPVPVVFSLQRSRSSHLSSAAVATSSSFVI